MHKISTYDDGNGFSVSLDVFDFSAGMKQIRISVINPDGTSNATLATLTTSETMALIHALSAKEG